MKLQIVEKALYKNIQNDADSFINSIHSKDDLGIELKTKMFFCSHFQ